MPTIRNNKQPTAGIVYPKEISEDFDREAFESGLSKSFSDFAYYLKTGDRSRFKPFKESIKEWKELADNVIHSI
jgi:hypothetical protein